MPQPEQFWGKLGHYQIRRQIHNASLHGRFGFGYDWEHRCVMDREQPAAIAVDENICRLDDGFVKTFGEGRREPDAARDPADSAFHANPHATECNAHAPGVRKDALPALANLVPTHKQIPAGLNALDRVVVSPD